MVKGEKKYFTWEEIENAKQQIDWNIFHISMKYAKQDYINGASPCPKCGTPPEDLFWLEKYNLAGRHAFISLNGRAPNAGEMRPDGTMYWSRNLNLFCQGNVEYSNFFRSQGIGVLKNMRDGGELSSHENLFFYLYKREGDKGPRLLEGEKLESPISNPMGVLVRDNIGRSNHESFEKAISS